MSFKVQLTDDAVRDVEDICDYVHRYRSPAAAEHVLKQIEQTLSSLSEYPYRGGFPKELLDVGIREYREIFFKPYRIVYRVTDSTVDVYLVADGRRDMRTLLQRRLLHA